MSKIIKSMAYNKTVRIYVIDSTELVEHARIIHKLMPTSAAALGRTLTCNLLMSSLLSEDQTIQINIKGNGFGGAIDTIASASGYVNGYIENPNVYITREDGHLDVAACVGKEGFIQITKDIGLKEKYVSLSPIVSGELGEDFTYFYASSEQIPTSVGLSVLVDQDQKVVCSGGFILQILPESICPDEVIDRIEELLGKMTPISEVLHSGGTVEDILSYLADNTEEIFEIKPVEFYCSCSKDGFLDMFAALSVDDLLDLSTDEITKATCPRCKTTYEFTSKELIDLANYKKEA